MFHACGNINMRQR